MHAKLLIVYQILMYRILRVDTLSIHTYSEKLIINLLLSYKQHYVYLFFFILHAWYAQRPRMEGGNNKDNKEEEYNGCWRMTGKAVLAPAMRRGGCDDEDDALGGEGTLPTMPQPIGGEDNKDSARQRMPSWVKGCMVATMDDRSTTEEDEVIATPLRLCCGHSPKTQQSAIVQGGGGGGEEDDEEDNSNCFLEEDGQGAGSSDKEEDGAMMTTMHHPLQSVEVEHLCAGLFSGGECNRDCDGMATVMGSNSSRNGNGDCQQQQQQ
jgi:hypothetical protein